MSEVAKQKKRNGKVAQLPRDVREVINLMYEDGATHDQVLARLAEMEPPITHLNDQNVINWYTGGYQDWLKERGRLEEMRAKREFALEIVRENEGSKIHEAGLQVAASQIYEVLSDFDVETLKEKLNGDPENFARIVNAMAKLSDGGLKYEKYRAEVSAAKERALAELGKASTAGLTAETRQKIEEALNLL